MNKVICDWKDKPAEWRFVQTAAFHAGHGNDMSKCDAWLCSCGNTAEAQGFHPCDAMGYYTDLDSNLRRCDRCETIYTLDGLNYSKVKLVTVEAGHEFWSAVAAMYPEIKTGDFPPDAMIAFEAAALTAIKTWVKGNQKL